MKPPNSTDYPHTACLLYGNSLHHLDHLAPFAALLDLSLLVTDKTIYCIANEYYPTLNVDYLSYDIFDQQIAQYDRLITCLPKKSVRPLLYLADKLRKYPIETIWLPHGNSDKGAHSNFMEALRDETYACVYGDKMIDFLKEKDAYSNLNECIRVGNFRHSYFQSHQIPLESSTKTRLLFSPTWQPESETDLLIHDLHSLKELSQYDVWIKLHPNTLQLNNGYLLHTLLDLEAFPHITMISHIPTIYPILDSVDLYIGDTSSIGYDYLTYNRPMLFLLDPKKQHCEHGPLTLHKCGIISQGYNLQDDIIRAIEEGPKFAEKREKLYNYTFSLSPSGINLQSWIDRQSTDIFTHL